MTAEAAPATALKRARYRLARDKAREYAAVYSSPPIPVHEIIQSNGLNVVFSEFGRFAEDVSGALAFEKRRVYVNRFDAPNRQRFTMAHEFGHWVLHKPFFDENPELYAVLPRFARPESNPFEQEANAFAAELLVPEHLLKQVRGAGPVTLARVFGVSREMMERRLKHD